jgi:hypothetical protein
VTKVHTQDLITVERNETLTVACGRFHSFFYIIEDDVKIMTHFFGLWRCLNEHRGFEDVAFNYIK